MLNIELEDSFHVAMPKNMFPDSLKMQLLLDL